jgi:hypothetical protein
MPCAIVPLLLNLPTSFGPCDSFLQNGLCFPNGNEIYVMTNFIIMYGMLATLKDNMSPTCPQHVPKNDIANPITLHEKTKVNAIVMVENYVFHL